MFKLTTWKLNYTNSILAIDNIYFNKLDVAAKI